MSNVLQNHKKTSVLTFGVFDGIHDGHRHILSSARNHAETMIVAITPDSIVQELKGRLPHHNEHERMSAMKKEYGDALVVLGDMTLGSWNIIHTYKPDIIVTGYDQHALRESLLNLKSDPSLNFVLETVTAYQPEVLHSRLLNAY